MIEDNQNRITQALANNDKEVLLTTEYVYQLRQENQQLKSRLQKRDKMIERLKTYVNFLKVDTPSGFTPFSRTILGEEILKFIDGETEEGK